MSRGADTHEAVDPPLAEHGAPANEAPHDRHDREVRESRREERRLLVWEVVCLVLVVGFVIVRQIWLV